jgi:hypothetical protein
MIFRVLPERASGVLTVASRITRLTTSSKTDGYEALIDWEFCESSELMLFFNFFDTNAFPGYGHG